MGYQLLVWDGPRPEDDAAAGVACGELMRRYFVGEGFEPTPAIKAYVEALTDRWPEDQEHLRSDDSPWKFPPLMDEASGPALFLNLRFGVGERAAYVMAEMAEERGLVAFDLYMNIMRPAPAEITDEIQRGWWADFFASMAEMTMDGDHGAKIDPMVEQIIGAGEFKARCLALLDDVAERRTEIVVTKRGVPVARVVPVAAAPSTEGSVTLLATDDESYFSVGEVWDADS